MDKVLNKMKVGDERKIWVSNLNRKLQEEQQSAAHAVMIYKARETKFNFFDPNTGFLEGLTAQQISTTLAHAASNTLGNEFHNIAFFDNRKILGKFQKSNHHSLINLPIHHLLFPVTFLEKIYVYEPIHLLPQKS